MPAILALDIATRTGWAYAGPAALAAWPATPLEAAAMPVPGFVVGSREFPGTVAALGGFADAYHEWLHDLMGGYTPTLVVFEAPFVGPYTGQAAARKLNGLAWHTEWLCRRLGVACEEAVPRDWRKHFTGVGSGKRKAMKDNAMAACTARGWPFANDDEADAAGILDYAVACVWARRRAAA